MNETLVSLPNGDFKVIRAQKPGEVPMAPTVASVDAVDPTAANVTALGWRPEEPGSAR